MNPRPKRRNRHQATIMGIGTIWQSKMRDNAKSPRPEPRKYDFPVEIRYVEPRKKEQGPPA